MESFFLRNLFEYICCFCSVSFRYSFLTYYKRWAIYYLWSQHEFKSRLVHSNRFWPYFGQVAEVCTILQCFYVISRCMFCTLFLQSLSGGIWVGSLLMAVNAACHRAPFRTWRKVTARRCAASPPAVFRVQLCCHSRESLRTPPAVRVHYPQSWSVKEVMNMRYPFAFSFSTFFVGGCFNKSM